MKIVNKGKFYFEEQYSHVWYKNLNIPSVKLICEEPYQIKFPPFNTKAALVSICKNMHDDQLSIKDLLGKSEQTLKWGECEFSSMRFANTSHYNKVSICASA